MQLVIHTITQNFVLLTSIRTIICTKIFTVSPGLLNGECVLSGRVTSCVHGQIINGEGSALNKLASEARIDQVCV